MLSVGYSGISARIINIYTGHDGDRTDNKCLVGVLLEFLLQMWGYLEFAIHAWMKVAMCTLVFGARDWKAGSSCLATKLDSNLKSISHPHFYSVL